ncbi:MAG: hypothetical protein KBD06_02435 [Candidatus Pacebacteria bacterium]|nr:hypothetical protein [Candidatus Paceibacterota bacterium]
MARKKKHAFRDEMEVVRRMAIVMALVLFIYATSIASPKVLVQDAGSMLGSAVVGMTVGVEPNPYNTAAVQLAAKQNELEAREELLRAQEGGSVAGTRMLAAGAFVTSILVLLLVAANYYMDWKRARRYA